MNAVTSPEVLDRPHLSAPDRVPTRGRIVVGVDGSPPSVDALSWVLHQALTTGATVEVVSCWSWPSAAFGYPLERDVDLGAPMRAAAESAVARAVAGIPGADAVTLSLELVEGHPASVLLRCAEGADLLVVASRGHGALTGMVLGSVSLHCVSHATCPVLVVRGQRDHSPVGHDQVAPDELP